MFYGDQGGIKIKICVNVRWHRPKGKKITQVQDAPVG